MYTPLNIMDTIFTFIGLLLVIFGWVVPYRNSIKADKIQARREEYLQKIQWKKEFVDKQISELYGPLYAIIMETTITYKRILEQLGRNCVIPENKGFYDLPEDEQKIWIHYVDTYKIPNQLKMIEIIRNNIHLFYNSELPESYINFLDYALGWELLDNQKRNGVKNYYEYYYSYNYPRNFDQYIKDTFRLLQAEQKDVLDKSRTALEKLNNLV